MEFLGWIIQIVVAVYLAIDSKKRGMNPWLWGILGFFFGLITLGIYFIKIGKKGLGWTITILALIFYIIFIILVVISTLLMMGTV
ncbi:hypothetical protein [Metabacillus arenae]|uniref:Uncharacterized protein n=1 Tax=Metabacillus arenae TaxID=2771434 RepID=A0A926NKH7_9BACI|nr:hypothetical protein [Metabacillus arenae]MBD1383021.1 hypothetical protein [Metabacillus arenae]